MTLRELWSNTEYFAKNRFAFADRDILYERIHIVRRLKYSAKTKRKTETFEIISFSNPHYAPYTRYKKPPLHKYVVYISFETKGISLDSRVKLRTGSDKKWQTTVTKQDLAYLRPKTVAEYNIKKLGINPDFYFRQSFLRAEKGVLFGRNYAPRPRGDANPSMKIWLTKHEIAVIEFLITKGIIKQ